MKNHKLPPISIGNTQRDWANELFSDEDTYGIKNAAGEILLPPVFEDFMGVNGIELRKGDKVIAKRNGRWGVAIADGKETWLIKPVFHYIGFPNPVTHVRKGNRWGIINIVTGDFIIPLTCEMVYDNHGFLFNNGIGFYKKEGKIGVIREDYSLTKPIFEDFDPGPEGPVKVKYNGKWGYINEENSFTTELDEADYWFEA